jgi:hypothetical protein
MIAHDESVLVGISQEDKNRADDSTYSVAFPSLADMWCLIPQGHSPHVVDSGSSLTATDCVT